MCALVSTNKKQTYDTIFNNNIIRAKKKHVKDYLTIISY